jgi:hypothetical protein
MDPSKQKSKLSPVWTNHGEILEVAYNSAKLRLDDGRVVIANNRRFKIFEEGNCGNSN